MAYAMENERFKGTAVEVCTSGEESQEFIKPTMSALGDQSQNSL
jgi:hypothetical protein